jgi:amino acid transporter
MDTLSWYAFGLVVAVALAAVMTITDAFILNVTSPNRRRKLVMLSTRWAFFCTILVFAWLIDSGRVPYNEPAIWLLLGAGIALSASLFVAARWAGENLDK